jgi:protein-S-isoprenylcysteine O-methyltransferase Ste14
MSMKWGSVLAFALMVAGLIWLVQRNEIVARTVPAMVVQSAAAALMIAARISFGMRSFHAAANPTSGGLVTTGPYRWLRHPIYAAIMYFIWATAIDHHTTPAILSAVMITTGAAIRMYAEEHLLVGMYPEYTAYSSRTARVVPFVL